MATLKQGDAAPDFTLTDQDGNPRSLAEFAGKRVLLYFYPKANTPGCTQQACAVRDALQELLDHDVQPLGVSPDTPKKQKSFDGAYTLGFPLLADEDHAVAEAYGAWGEKSMYGKTYMGIVRSAFLIDTNGAIRAAWYKVSPNDTVPNVLALL